ncbi:hypothetical protein [Novipirellula sp.]|uniref:hypothetical protein n=1 Tax=Novipirellula sp. TaxID=2795430 RepID=UPI003562B355
MSLRRTNPLTGPGKGDLTSVAAIFAQVTRRIDTLAQSIQHAAGPPALPETPHC